MGFLTKTWSRVGVRVLFVGSLFWVTLVSISVGVGYGEPSLAWDQIFGGSGDDYGRSVVQTSDGGYIVIGYSGSSGAGDDVYLIKTDSSGTEAWSKTYGGANNDYGRSVAQTSDEGYILTGYTSSSGAGNEDVYLVKTDSNGVESWSKTFGGADNDRGYSVAQTSDGGYIIAGETWSFGAGAMDVYLVKTDSNGIETWSKTYGGASSDRGYSVVQTIDGGYIIAGYSGNDVYLIKTDSSGTEAWSKTYGGGSINYGLSVAQTSDGGFIITGAIYPSFPGSPDVYLVKTDVNGVESWSKTYGGIGFDRGQSVVQTSDGGYIIAGETSSSGAGGYDVYLIKTDSSGVEVWSKTFGGTSDDQGYSVVQTSDGGYIIAGETSSSGAGGYDVYLLKLETPAPVPSPTRKPNPGITYFDRNVCLTDCVNFYLIIRDMNKTGVNCLHLSITDNNDQVVYTRECRIRCNTNWYMFYLCKDRFNPGTYTVKAISNNWIITKQIKIQ